MKTNEKKFANIFQIAGWRTISIIFAILLLLLITYYFRFFLTRSTTLYTDRAQERIKAAQDIYILVQTSINEISWIDREKGIIHIPVPNAMNLIVNIYNKKETARSEFLKRIENANNGIKSSVTQPAVIKQ